MRTLQDARLCQGDDTTLLISIANSSGLDMTNCQAKYIASKSSIGPTAPIITKATGSGITVITGVGVPVGYAIQLKVVLSNDDTDDVVPGWYYHEAMLTLANGSTVTVMSGKLRVDPSWSASRL
jgi:hypothetical protein